MAVHAGVLGAAVAMGIQGSEVAEGASDMILWDDNFATIVTAVEKSCVIHAGIQKSEVMHKAGVSF